MQTSSSWVYSVACVTLLYGPLWMISSLEILGHSSSSWQPQHQNQLGSIYQTSSGQHCPKGWGHTPSAGGVDVCCGVSWRDFRSYILQSEPTVHWLMQNNWKLSYCSVEFQSNVGVASETEGGLGISFFSTAVSAQQEDLQLGLVLLAWLLMIVEINVKLKVCKSDA